MQQQVASQTTAQAKKFLIIQHGGMMEFAMSMGAFAAIRKAKPHDHITLMTTAAFEELAKASGYFNYVWVDELLSPIEIAAFYKFIKRFRGAHFQGVFDLSNTNRTEWYFRLLGRKKPHWNGVVEWASHPYLEPEYDLMHYQDRLEGQLQEVAITDIPESDFSMVDTDISRFDLPPSYALLFPAGVSYNDLGDEAPEALGISETWDLGNFYDVAEWLQAHNITPVIVAAGGEEEKAMQLNYVIKNFRPLVLSGNVNHLELISMARRAKIAIGNDHAGLWLTAYSSCPTVIISPGFSDYKQRTPRVANVRMIAPDDLDLLNPKQVIRVCKELLMLDKV